MRPSRNVIITCVAITLACMFFGVCGGVSWSALHLTGKPQVFRSLAKIVAGGPSVKNGDLSSQENLRDFYGTIIVTLESAEMHRKARERVHALHPDLRDSAVEIRVAQTKGSAIFNILATGSEPKFTQIFLNALLDEFMAFRQSIKEQTQGGGLNSLLQAVVNKQKEMELAFDQMEAADRDFKSIQGRSEPGQLTARMRTLNKEMDDLKVALQANPADAVEKRARLRMLEYDAEDLGKQITESDAALAKLNAAKKRHAELASEYKKVFEQAETEQMELNARSDYAAVQERATFASEHVEDWKMAVIIGGLGGAVAGFVVGFIISLPIILLSGSRTSPA